MERIYDWDDKTCGYCKGKSIYNKHHHKIGYIDGCRFYSRDKSLVGYVRDNIIFNCCNEPLGYFIGYTVVDVNHRPVGYVHSSFDSLLAAAGLFLILDSFRRPFRHNY